MSNDTRTVQRTIDAEGSVPSDEALEEAGLLRFGNEILDLSRAPIFRPVTEESTIKVQHPDGTVTEAKLTPANVDQVLGTDLFLKGFHTNNKGALIPGRPRTAVVDAVKDGWVVTIEARDQHLDIKFVHPPLSEDDEHAALVDALSETVEKARTNPSQWARTDHVVAARAFYDWDDVQQGLRFDGALVDKWTSCHSGVARLVVDRPKRVSVGDAYVYARPVVAKWSTVQRGDEVLKWGTVKDALVKDSPVNVVSREAEREAHAAKVEAVRESAQEAAQTPARVSLRRLVTTWAEEAQRRSQAAVRGLSDHTAADLAALSTYDQKRLVARIEEAREGQAQADHLGTFAKGILDADQTVLHDSAKVIHIEDAVREAVAHLTRQVLVNGDEAGLPTLRKVTGQLGIEVKVNLPGFD